MDRIDELRDAHKGHVAGLTDVESRLRDTILRMTERSNADPTDGESDGRQSGEGEETTTGDAKAEGQPALGAGEKAVVTSGDIGTLTEQLTVNGVSKQS